MNGSIIAAGKPYGIFVSTDGGITWDMRQHGLSRQSVTRLIVHPLVPRFQYALGDMMDPGNNLYRTTDAGLSWSTIGAADDIDVSPIDTMVLFRSTGEIYSEGIEKSIDGGITWVIKFSASPLNPGMPSQFMHSRKVVTHKFNPNIIFGMVLRKYEDMNLLRVFRSMDAGETWDSLGLPRSILNGIYGIWFDPESPSRMYLSHDWGFITSSDNGSSWSTLSIPTLGVQILDIVDLIVTPGENTQLFAATSRGVFRSLDRGQSWHMIGDSTVEFPVVSLALDQNNILYAASSNSGIYKTSNPVTTVKRDLNTMPAVLSLKQNYPNPFNPSTIISFDLPSKGFVWLKVFNLLGQEVATVVSEVLTSGNHSRQWNAEGLSSGVYFYRLQVGSFIQTKKLVLLK